eukprot:CAMPEP_0197289946 /NCGR_PEP_ID=MMETSP0890-20130614/7214_1 /TAXON_ID=44058 ORGANISM="Aureoumbra lagunensis, Strain CCMP1510" /NCGR_SAMPLE_ID=MMETSP0890 /ASSEMBLY_ACC=CAM_ASM_000533 /LENGTH=709 /DNA_ID=CAMNT_0042761683 /DNA_START=112 /DNA_END=2241 /DNA_ORIENTATION=-
MTREWLKLRGLIGDNECLPRIVVEREKNDWASETQNTTPQDSQQTEREICEEPAFKELVEGIVNDLKNQGLNHFKNADVSALIQAFLLSMTTRTCAQWADNIHLLDIVTWIDPFFINLAPTSKGKSTMMSKFFPVAELISNKFKEGLRRDYLQTMLDQLNSGLTICDEEVAQENKNPLCVTTFSPQINPSFTGRGLARELMNAPTKILASEGHILLDIIANEKMELLHTTVCSYQHESCKKTLKTAQDSYNITHPSLAILAMVQPSIYYNFVLRNPELVHQGFNNRFLFWVIIDSEAEVAEIPLMFPDTNKRARRTIMDISLTQSPMKENEDDIDSSSNIEKRYKINLELVALVIADLDFVKWLKDIEHNGIACLHNGTHSKIPISKAYRVAIKNLKSKYCEKLDNLLSSTNAHKPENVPEVFQHYLQGYNNRLPEHVNKFGAAAAYIRCAVKIIQQKYPHGVSAVGIPEDYDATVLEFLYNEYDFDNLKIQSSDSISAIEIGLLSRDFVVGFTYGLTSVDDVVAVSSTKRASDRFIDTQNAKLHLGVQEPPLSTSSDIEGLPAAKRLIFIIMFDSPKYIEGNINNNRFQYTSAPDGTAANFKRNTKQYSMKAQEAIVDLLSSYNLVEKTTGGQMKKFVPLTGEKSHADCIKYMGQIDDDVAQKKFQADFNADIEKIKIIMRLIESTKMEETVFDEYKACFYAYLKNTD